jgi:hypothetical protein
LQYILNIFLWKKSLKNTLNFLGNCVRKNSNQRAFKWQYRKLRTAVKYLQKEDKLAIEGGKYEEVNFFFSQAKEQDFNLQQT